MMFGSAPVSVPLAALEASVAADRYGRTTIWESGRLLEMLSVGTNTLRNDAC
jgi:hypothetical protein